MKQCKMFRYVWMFGNEISKEKFSHLGRTFNLKLSASKRSEITSVFKKI